VGQAVRVYRIDAGPAPEAPVGGIQLVGGGKGLGQGERRSADVAAVERAADEDGGEGGAGDALAVPDVGRVEPLVDVAPKWSD
jgi:hypothetical protein